MNIVLALSIIAASVAEAKELIHDDIYNNLLSAFVVIGLAINKMSERSKL